MSQAARVDVVQWVEPGSIRAEDCPACQWTDRARWVYVRYIAGRTLLDDVLLIVVEKSVQLALMEGSRLDPVESVLEFMGEWPSATEEIVVAYANVLHERSARRIAEGRMMFAMIEEARKKGARPVQGGRAPGTRKARRKRKQRGRRR